MTKPPSLDLHDQLLQQRIALVPDRSAVDVELEVFAKSRPTGALKGAGQGIAGMLQGFGGGSCSGEFCGAALLLYLALAVVVGGTVGAIHGSMAATPAQASAGMEDFIDRQLREFFSHLALTQKVFGRSREVAGLNLDLVPLDGRASRLSGEELHRLAAAGYQKALTVRLVRCDFVGDHGDDPQLGLYLEAQAGIVDLGNRAEVYHREFRFIGPARRYSAWRRLDPAVLVAEVEASLDTLAAQIVDGLLLAYALPIGSGSWAFPGTADYGCCWLCPVTPPLKLDFFPQVKQEWPTVSSWQPRLEWQPFPGEQRQAQLQEQTGHQAANVRYDLRIWEMVGFSKGNPAYERYALPASSHRVEDPLKPRTAYLWSVRACFDLAGRPACTPWAFSLVPAGPDACESTTVSPEHFYRFRTP